MVAPTGVDPVTFRFSVELFDVRTGLAGCLSRETQLILEHGDHHCLLYWSGVAVKMQSRNRRLAYLELG